MENNLENNNEKNIEEATSESVSQPAEPITNVAKKKLPIGIIAAIIGGAVLVLIAVIIAVLLLGGNQGNQGNEGPEITYVDYTVTVVDGLKNPVSNVLVTFKNDSGQSKMRVTEKDGIATYKNAPAGNYTVIIEKGYSNAIILQSEYSLTADNREITVIVRDAEKTIDITGKDIPEGTYAYQIKDGMNSILSEENQIIYYVFKPQVTGIYNFSLVSSSGATLNLYGLSDEDVKSSPADTGKTHETGFEYTITNTGFTYVLGVNADKSEQVQLLVEKIGEAPYELSGFFSDRTYADVIGEGTQSFDAEANKTKYFVFFAPSDGIYKISFASSDEEMTVGYYGNPMFVMPEHCGDGEYDGKSFELIIKDISSPYTIGVNATKDTEAKLIVERIGDAPFDPNYAEWIEVTAKGPFTTCDTTGKTLVDIDLSLSSFDLVLGSDGYYYTAEGKAVYIRLTTAPGHSYTDESFNTHPIFGGSLALMAGLVEGQDVGNNIGGYIYDENGNFVNKYRYNQMIETYLEYVDGSYGVVQLNEELVECIKLHGKSSGWFNPDSYGYLFEYIEVNDDISWLFLCMVEQ